MEPQSKRRTLKEIIDETRELVIQNEPEQCELLSLLVKYFGYKVPYGETDDIFELAFEMLLAWKVIVRDENFDSKDYENQNAKRVMPNHIETVKKFIESERTLNVALLHEFVTFLQSVERTFFKGFTKEWIDVPTIYSLEKIEEALQDSSLIIVQVSDGLSLLGEWYGFPETSLKKIMAELDSFKQKSRNKFAALKRGEIFLVENDHEEMVILDSPNSISRIHLFILAHRLVALLSSRLEIGRQEGFALFRALLVTYFPENKLTYESLRKDRSKVIKGSRQPSKDEVPLIDFIDSLQTRTYEPIAKRGKLGFHIQLLKDIAALKSARQSGVS